MTSPISTMASPSSPSSSQTQPGPPGPRKSLKVKIVSWNMADSLPKGDLCELFGTLPPYSPPSSPPTSLPDFDTSNDSHPYHLIVVAAQECRSQSGVPRGLATGVTRGLGGGSNKEKLKDRSSSIRINKEREDSKDLKEKERETAGLGTSAMTSTSTLETQAMLMEESMATAPGTPTTTEEKEKPPHHGHHLLHINPGGRGWSDILEDYFCNGIQAKSRSSLTTTMTSSNKQTALPPHQTPPRSRTSSRASTRGGGGAPSITSADVVPPTPPKDIPSPSPNPAMAMASRTSFPFLTAGEQPPAIGGKHALARSPLSIEIRDSPLAAVSRSSSVDSGSLLNEHALSLSDAGGSPMPPIPPSKTDPMPGSSSLDAPRPLGPYQFLVKERLMGLYVAIFVHRDCRPWVEGVDHDYVPAGVIGGRVGNKGGIGISLKMAGHRFLFVNSHLAAHTHRLDARLANVEKIKSELHLDCFFPEDHPVAQAEDLCDRFDTTFWLGDLNFRLEVSRLHADWLITRREYAQALEFDQLRKVMKNGWAFEGFCEAPIDFPPTFKYDVWHSAKRTRSLRKKTESRRQRADSRATVTTPLCVLPEAGDLVLSEEPATDDDASVVFTDDRRSIESSSIPLSTIASVESDPSQPRGHYAPVTVPQPIRPLAAVARTSAIKAKSKLMNFLKSSTPSSPEPAETTNHFEPSNLSSTPEETTRPGLHRTISSKLKRTLSGRPGAPLPATDSTDSSSDEEDTREGVYDTSSKQRVPSWCDRVLWRTHVVPEPQTATTTHVAEESPLGRLGAALATKLHHRRHRQASPHRAITTVSTTPASPISPLGGSSTSSSASSPAPSLGGRQASEHYIRSGPREDPLPRSRTITAGDLPGAAERGIESLQESIQTARRWLNQLSMHHRTSIDDHDATFAPTPAPPPPPTHLKGEVVCLHYGTIDDAGMRRLEGRSDHRPIIFAAAVYI